MPVKSRVTPNTTTNYWTAPVITKWPWPLRVGLYTKSRMLLKQILFGHWSRELCPPEEVGKARKQYELLIIENPALVDKISHSKFSSKARIVLVQVDKSSLRKSSGSTDKIATDLKKKLNASGVIFFSTGLPFNQWYEQFVIELSHNRSVGEAVQSVPQTIARSYQTKSLDTEARLSVSITQLLEELKDKKLAKTGRISIRQPNGQVIWVNLADAVNYLRTNLDHLPYTHEKGTASTARGVSDELRKKEKKKSGSTKLPIVKSVKSGNISIGSNRLSGKKTPTTGRSFLAGLKKLAKKKAVRRKAVKKAAPKKKGGGSRFPGGGQKLRVNATNSIKSLSGKVPGKVKPGKKKSAKKISEPSAGSAAPGPQPNYLLAAFRKPGREQKPEKKFLLPNERYNLYVKLGVEDIEFLKAPLAMTKEEVFEKVTTDEVTVDLEVRLNTQTKVLYGKLTWPRNGDSDLAKFIVRTGNKQEILKADIIAYYGNRMLQRAVFSIEIRKPDAKAKLKSATFKIEASLRTQPVSLNNSIEFDAVIATSGKPDASRPMAGRSKGESLPFTYPDAMKEVVKKIKARLEKAAIQSTKQQSLDSPGNLDILIPLANQGSILFKTFLNSLQLDGPLQLVNNSGSYLPLDFAYTRLAPNGNAKLCEHAVKALESGKCAGCIKSKDEERNFICPFGFWALSQVVERHQYKAMADPTKGNFELKSVPDKQKKALQVLNLPLHGSSSKVDLAKKGLREAVRKLINDNCNNRLLYAKDWKEWSAAIPRNPDSLILIVHIETDPKTDVDSLEIGTKLLDHTQLDHRYIPIATTDRAPFIILIGCEASNTDEYLFDTVSSLFQQGAGIVVSNFTRIVGDQAAALVMELIRVLKSEARKTASFGEIMLRLRQRLMAKGILAGLSLLAHGDANWKIKA